MAEDLGAGQDHTMPEPQAGGDVLGLAEAILDVLSMYLTYLLTVWLVLPIFGFEVEASGYATFAVVLMWMSLSRKFWLDMLFRWLRKKRASARLAQDSEGNSSRRLT